MKRTINPKISKKLTPFVLISILSLSIVVIGYLLYQKSLDGLKTEKEVYLKSIGESKIESIVNWNQHKTNDANTFRNSPIIIELIEKLLKNLHDPQLKENIFEQLQLGHKEYDYEGIYLSSIRGDILLSVGTNESKFDSITKAKIVSAAKNKELSYTDLYFCPSHQKIHYDIIAPIINANKNIISVLVFRIDPADYLFPFLKIWPVPSKSSETILVRKEGDEVLFLNDLKFQKNAALNFRLPLTKNELPAVQAVLGTTGIFEGIDYRGETVIAYLNKIIGTNWFIVTKIDRNELLTDVQFRQEISLLFFGLLLLSIVVGLSFFYLYKRRNIYKKLWETQEEYKTTLYSIGDGVITTDLNGRVKSLNPVAEKLTGWMESEAIGKPLKDIFKIFDEETKRRIENAAQLILKRGVLIGFTNHTILISKNDSEIPIESSGSQIKDDKGEVIGVVIVFHDQTAERATQKEILRLNRVHALLSNTNQAIVRIHEKQTLFDEICRIAIENGKFSMAWIGIVDNETNLVDVKSSAGNVGEYLDNININLKDEQRNQGPTGRAILNGEHFISNDIENDEFMQPWKKHALELGYRSSAAFPISVFGNVVGAFNIYSNEVGFYQSQELELLDEMATDISFALEYIETENKRKQAEFELEESEKKFRTVIEEATEIIFTTDEAGKFTYFNPAGVKASGYTLEELLNLNYLELIVPKHRKRVALTYIRQFKNKTELSTLEYLLKVKNGQPRWVNQNARLIFENDTAKGFYVIARDITDKKNAELALKESEEKFRAVIEEAVEIIFTTDKKGNFTYVNPAGLKSSGYTREELAKFNYLDLIEPEFKDTIARIYMRQFIRKTGITGTEYIFRTKSGEKKWFNQNARLIIENGEVKGWYVIARDITERRKAEIALMESEKKFRTLFNTTIEGICSTDSNEKITMVNPRFADFVGYSMKELNQMSFHDLISPDDLEDQKLKTESRKKGESDIYERQLIKKDGSTIWLLVSASPILGKGDKYLGSFGMFTDITEKKLAEIEIRKLYSGVEQSPASVVITNLDGNIEYVNSKFCSVTGYDRSEVIGKNPRILKTGEKSQEDYKTLWSTITSGKEWIGEFHNKKKNGEMFWESALISPIIDEKGAITHFIGIKEDITDKKKIMQDLVEAKEKAEEINRLKSYFFANMSHELRTPFVGIQGFAELLAEKIEDSESMQLVDGIIESSKRLTETLNKILNLSKIEFESVEVQNSDVDITALIRDSYELFNVPAENKGLKFEFINLDEPLLINSDEKLIRGIITNLLNNALKFTIKGRIGLEAVIEEKENLSEYIRLTVWDTGVGIPKDKHEQVWLPFRQASEGLNRKFEGTGLGLTIVKKYVELLNGEIKLISDVGNGTSFVVTIPINRVISSRIDDSKKHIVNKPKSKGSIKKLLYVDDDKFSRIIVDSALSNQYKLEMVSNADLAYQKIIDEEFDALLIDINLGSGIDGVQLMEKIRRHPSYKNKPMIAITAYASDSDREEFLRSGFTDYISKPFSLKALRILIDGLFSTE